MRRIALVLTLAAVTLLLAQSPPPYRVTHTYALGGDGSWDYIVPDPPNHRLFIARQNRVMVVDQDKGVLLGEVTGIQGAHGTALAPATGHGFATSGTDQSVVMFDLKTFKALGRIPAAEDADAILFDSASNRVFTLNGDAHSSTVIDPGAGKLVTNIPLGGKPEYGASAGDGKVYLGIQRAWTNFADKARGYGCWCSASSMELMKLTVGHASPKKPRSALADRGLRKGVAQVSETVDHRAQKDPARQNM